MIIPVRDHSGKASIVDVPQEIIDKAQKIATFFNERNIVGWQLGQCKDARLLYGALNRLMDSLKLAQPFSELDAILDKDWLAIYDLCNEVDLWFANNFYSGWQIGNVAKRSMTTPINPLSKIDISKIGNRLADIPIPQMEGLDEAYMVTSKQVIQVI